jgi:hypothetical protein
MKNLIGFDFSINKPAACLKSGNDIQFFGWPHNPRKAIVDIYKQSGVNIYERIDDKDKGPDISSKMRYEVHNARYISEVITVSLKPWLNRNTYIGFEGISYGSSGDVVLQLGGYKYMLMNALSEYVPLDNMFTYSPITVKKTADCSKRGTPKSEVIEAFISSSLNNSLKTAIRKDREKFMKKGGKNFIDHLDDLVDSYWVLETLRDKEKLS